VPIVQNSKIAGKLSLR